MKFKYRNALLHRCNTALACTHASARDLRSDHSALYRTKVPHCKPCGRLGVTLTLHRAQEPLAPPVSRLLPVCLPVHQRFCMQNPSIIKFSMLHHGVSCARKFRAAFLLSMNMQPCKSLQHLQDHTPNQAHALHLHLHSTIL